MALARVHVWSAGEVLTASDLNAEINNVLNNPVSLISPLTATLNFNGNQATNLRFETQSATQSAAAEGVVYWHTSEDALHVSTGTVQARIPALTGIQHGELVGILSPSGSGDNGATTYARFQLGAGLTLSGTVLSGGSPTGSVSAYAGSSAPTGWLLCDGSAVSRTTYADLFAIISTTYGNGDGTTTFHVPDLRGKTAIGVGTGPSLTARVLAATGGAETHTLTVPEMPAHTHTENTGTAGAATAGGIPGGETYTPGVTELTSDSTGGGGAHNNMQPFLVLTYIIKT